MNNLHHVKCTNPRCARWHKVARPAGASHSDMFVAHPSRGGVLLILCTSDVREGDLIALRWRGRTYAGFFEAEAAGRWLLTDADGEPQDGYFERGEIRIVGRAVEVQRRGEAIDPPRPLRPIRGGGGGARSFHAA